MKNTFFFIVGFLFLLPAFASDLSDVDALIGKQQYKEALIKLSPVIEAAEKKNADSDYTKLLIKEVQLNVGLHGYEKAVETLKKRKWPEAPLSLAMIHILYANTLRNYHDAYSWEIRKRELISGNNKMDIKTWTSSEIYQEAYRSFNSAWALRDKLEKLQREKFSELTNVNTYPKEVRGTLRDVLSYLFVDLLKDTSGWTPQDNNSVYQLNLSSLLQGESKVSPVDADKHPLEKISMILTDLEKWHQDRKAKDAALEARFERYRVLFGQFDSEKDKLLIISTLEKDLSRFSTPWVSMGYATLAEFQKSTNSVRAKVQAHASASRGIKLFPDSAGAVKCRDILREIEQPSFELEGMNIDTHDKRSIGINYRNLRKLYFKSIKIDFKEFITSTKDFSLRPGWRELEKLLKNKPSHSWSVSLKETEDFANHMAYVIPPKHQNGFYAVLASNEETFEKGVIQGLQTFFSDYSFEVTRDFIREEFRVEVVKGKDGSSVKDASVILWQADYQTGHSKKIEAATDNNGVVIFNTRSFSNKGSGNYFFTVEKDGQVIGSRGPSYIYSQVKSERKVKDAFIYTDRSVYRPGQKILWKIVAYKGDGQRAFSTDSSVDVEVTLTDGNGEKVISKKVRTNSFGSTSGEFTIPQGKLLGNWSITSNHGGHAYVQIEEYKRPTFILEMSDKGEELRLNKKAVLKGKGKYYFGQPLANAKGKYTVHRRVILPWWCFWGGFNWGGPQGDIFVTSGDIRLASDGSFEISFIPEADERGHSSSDDLRYVYTVRIDVTDDGGETQGLTYETTVGLSALNATIALDQEFYFQDHAPSAVVTRTDLNGRPLQGNGQWKLIKLITPKETLSPSELPVPEELKGLSQEFKHSDDFRLKRWSASYRQEDYLRSLKSGETIKTGKISHHSNGEGRLFLPKLKEGIYRLVYESTDSFGGHFDLQKEFLVVTPKSQFNLPGFFAIQNSSAEPGEIAKLLVMSGYPDQRLILETFKKGILQKREEITAGKDSSIIEVPVKEEDRGGLSFVLRTIHDYQILRSERFLSVPWTDRMIDVAFETFRDKLRPGTKETLTITVKGKNGYKVDPDAIEILSYMYDKSLDSILPHRTPSPLSIFPDNSGVNYPESELGAATLVYTNRSYFPYAKEFRDYHPDSLKFLDNYGIGGPGMRGGIGNAVLLKRSMHVGMALETESMAMPPNADISIKKRSDTPQAAPQSKAIELRTNFSENGFWKPHLRPGKDQSVKVEFQVPDTLTAWNVWAHIISKTLQSGSVSKETRTVKELMIRPYLPRFIREGDEALIKVMVNNVSDKDMTGDVEFEIKENEKVLLKKYLKFSAKKINSSSISFPFTAPAGARGLTVKVTAKSGQLSDGEVRSLPVLPGRIHLAESKFVTLKNQSKKEITFKEKDDPTLVNDLFVVTLDAQLFYSVLSSVPYLVNYPYQSTDQIMNAFVATGILSSVFRDYPELKKMAVEFSKRKSQFEKWDDQDPNRRTLLEESPWLSVAKGGNEDDVMAILEPEMAKKTRDKMLLKLRDSQTASGGFPWFSGGAPSPYQTLYVLYGLSKAVEFNIEIPKPMVVKAWSYLHDHYVKEIVRDLTKENVGHEFVTFLNYVLSRYPDKSWTNNLFSDADRKTMLDFSFRHWKEHSPYLKAYLALTLKKSNRDEDAKLVWNSVIDSAEVSEEEGTHWAQEDRSWLWYRDTIETHAMALRTGSELGVRRETLDGIVQWLFLNKKLNHWKSTKGTAEVLYSLVHFLGKTKQLGKKESIQITIGNKTQQFDFNPERYSGKKNQIVSSAPAKVTIEKQTPGLAFASATWHYSTENLTTKAQGDFLSVERRFFKRSGGKLTLLKNDDSIYVGDEVEVHLSLTSKHQVEYVHLRDPRAAGFEPVNSISQHKGEFGIIWYEEIRDSGTNFFFERLPQGEYTFKYRIRASMAGKFKASPATIEPLYAPEFKGHSDGSVLLIK